jgi:hypothetical protein
MVAKRFMVAKDEGKLAFDKNSILDNLMSNLKRLSIEEKKGLLDKIFLHDSVAEETRDFYQSLMSSQHIDRGGTKAVMEKNLSHLMKAAINVFESSPIILRDFQNEVMLKNKNPDDHKLVPKGDFVEGKKVYQFSAKEAGTFAKSILLTGAVAVGALMGGSMAKKIWTGIVMDKVSKIMPAEQASIVQGLMGLQMSKQAMINKGRDV